MSKFIGNFYKNNLISSVKNVSDPCNSKCWIEISAIIYTCVCTYTCVYVYNKDKNESLACIILLIIQVTGNILEHKRWNFMIKKEEGKEEIQGKAVDGQFSHPYLPKSPINIKGVSWLLSPPHSSLPNYKALKFYSPEGKRWCPLLTFFLS